MAAISKFVSRSAMGWPETKAGYANTNRGMIAHYDSSTWLTRRRSALVADGRSPHGACIEYWNRCRSMHINGNGWVDVGYAYFCCPDGYVFAGREVNHQQAAQAPTPGKMQDGNSRYVAVTFALGPGEVPTDEAIEGWHRLRDWLMSARGVASGVYGHRDFTATSCPGDKIYALRNSKLKTKPKPTQPATLPSEPTPTPNGDEMPEIVSLGIEKFVFVPPSVDYQPWWTAEWRDTAGWHPSGGQSIAPNVDVWADLVAHITLTGFEPGEPVMVGFTRHLADGTLVDIAWPESSLMVVHADPNGRVDVGMNAQFKLSATNRGRVTIHHTSANPIRLEKSSLFKAILHRYPA